MSKMGAYVLEQQEKEYDSYFRESDRRANQLIKSNKIDELLVITMEECGELTQACSKVIRTKALQEKFTNNLKDEIGDVAAMIELLKEFNLVSQAEIDQRIAVKKKKLEQWSTLFER
jgi:NTP pyrophosphatase (non-canonical NTP hydrolase)|tara:strand:+ start:806 stop:1156 length:351 start_codon:yes stop_codon:yes gene_type:complete